MPLFGRKPKITACEMCGRSADDGCGSAHNHIEAIHGDQPAWLPAHLRAQADGEFTWLCVRCQAYPAVKWPHTGGAWAGIMCHLGADHHVGDFQGLGDRIDMIRVGTP